MTDFTDKNSWPDHVLKSLIDTNKRLIGLMSSWADNTPGKKDEISTAEEKIKKIEAELKRRQQNKQEGGGHPKRKKRKTKKKKRKFTKNKSSKKKNKFSKKKKKKKTKNKKKSKSRR